MRNLSIDTGVDKKKNIGRALLTASELGSHVRTFVTNNKSQKQLKGHESATISGESPTNHQNLFK